jgi:AcrR family transcriptional regulator
VTEYAGSGARSLELLWRTKTPPSRGPKPKLDLDRIVEAAIAIADEEGLAPLSMRKVAERLGVATMSLYTYVPGKSELLDLMIDTTVALASAGDDALPGDDDAQAGAAAGPPWRARLERIAREGWERYHRHPWLLEITMVRPVLGPNVTARYDYELRAIDQIGLSDIEMDAVISLIAGHVEGAARRSVEAKLAERRTGVSDLEWWEQRAPILAELFDATAYPTAARVGQAAGEAHNAAYAPEHSFEFGLQRILDGVENLVRARALDEDERI